MPLDVSRRQKFRAGPVAPRFLETETAEIALGLRPLRIVGEKDQELEDQEHALSHANWSRRTRAAFDQFGSPEVRNAKTNLSSHFIARMSGGQKAMLSGRACHFAGKRSYTASTTGSPIQLEPTDSIRGCKPHFLEIQRHERVKAGELGALMLMMTFRAQAELSPNQSIRKVNGTKVGKYGSGKKEKRNTCLEPTCLVLSSS